MGVKICIALISNRGVKPKTVLSLMEMIAHTKHEVIPIIATEGFNIAENRTFSVIQALKAGCTHILFIDDDMVFPKNTIERLLANDKKIVGVASYSRKLPLSTTVALLGSEGQPITGDIDIPLETFECYSVGMGVALIDLSIFDEIDKPWFSFEAGPLGKVVKGEDEWMCIQARNKGIGTYCDPTISVGHLGDYNYTK